jgi:succinoglycan biosynthesis protein ExoM
MATGTVVSGSGLRLGNVLLQSSLLSSLEAPFDPGTEATPASDIDVLGRLVRGGARLVWCDEAIVRETVDGSRLSLRWLLQRALRDGQEAARDQLTVRRGRLPRANRYALLLSAIAHSVKAASLAVLSWPRGRHHAARWLIEATTQAGTIPILLTSEPISSARDSAPTARRAA